MSVRNFIKDSIPESWDKAATQLRMKTELIERLYATIPQNYRNKYRYKEGIRMIARAINYWNGGNRCNIIFLVDATDIDLKKWEELNELINEYENQCM